MVLSVAAFALAGSIFLFWCLGGFFILNRTPSLPYGLYFCRPIRIIQPGILVVIDLPPETRMLMETRGYIPKSGFLLKHIGALEGDSYMVDDKAFYVKKALVGPVKDRDSCNRLLPKIRGKFTVPPEYFLPVSATIPNSFDGRYLGAMPLKLIKSELIPLLIWS